MTAVLQLSAFVAALAALVAYGIWRDKAEHRPQEKDSRQDSFYFHKEKEQTEHRGAAMSRIG